MSYVEFNPEKHEYRDRDGNVVMSVTQILKAAGIYNLNFVPSDVRDAAMDLGTRVHRVLELDDLHALNTRKLSKDMRGYYKAWREWKKASGFVPTLIEHVFISAHGYAGTIDRAGYFKSNPHVAVFLDIKSGVAIPEGARYQLSAYACGVPPERVGLLCKATGVRRIAWRPRLDSNPPYTIKEFPVADYLADFAYFMACLRRVRSDAR